MKKGIEFVTGVCKVVWFVFGTWWVSESSTSLYLRGKASWQSDLGSSICKGVVSS
jgi:uncharacterized protein YgiM (DUF1202 family)